MHERPIILAEPEQKYGTDSDIMHRLFAVALIALSFVVTTAHKVCADQVPEAMPLMQSLDQATIIVAASLTGYKADPNVKRPKPNTSIVIDGKEIHYYSGFSDLIVHDTIRPPGTYDFQTIQVIKGKVGPHFAIDLSWILNDYYRNDSIPIETNRTFLLMLSQDADGKLRPIDYALPLIPISLQAQKERPKLTSPEDFRERAIRLIASSCAVPELRQADTFILRHVVDPTVVLATAPYVNDPNIKTRDNALCAMAVNQQVEAIPLIAALALNPKALAVGTASFSALNSYQTPEATPYMNTLSFSPSTGVRQVAQSELDRVGDHSSIPYCILGLHDPVLSYTWHVLAHYQIPDLPYDRSFAAFQQNREKALSILNAWWSDELMGKHLAADKRTIPAEKRAALKTLDGLNKTLFEPYPELREAAIVALGARADNSSIPYLALALQDPDQKVSYGAYRLLVRLTGAGKPAAGEAEYAASTDMVKAPLYAWWADELNGKHLPPPQHTELR